VITLAAAQELNVPEVAQKTSLRGLMYNKVDLTYRQLMRFENGGFTFFGTTLTVSKQNLTDTAE
jgi:hypothetical protein